MTGLLKQTILKQRPTAGLTGNALREAQHLTLNTKGIAQEGFFDSIKKFFAPYGDEAEMRAYHLGIQGWLRSANQLSKQLDRKIGLPSDAQPLQLKGSIVNFLIGDQLVPNEELAKELGRINELCELYAEQWVEPMDKMYSACAVEYILPAIYFRYNKDRNLGRTIDYKIPRDMMDMMTNSGPRSGIFSRGGLESDHLMGNWFLWCTGAPNPVYKVDLVYVLESRFRGRETGIPCLTKDQCIDILDRCVSILNHCAVMLDSETMPGYKKIDKAMIELYEDRPPEDDSDYSDSVEAWNVGHDLTTVGQMSVRAAQKASGLVATMLKFVELSIRRMT